MRPITLLLASGALGFILGAFRFPTLQVAVESSQVVAGIVHYPPGHSFYVYHTKIWTILHQLGALLLHAGVPELLLSRLISGLLGIVGLQALAMLVYATSRNGVLALVSALVIILTAGAEGWSVYPIEILGTTHTYGAIGLSLVVLTFGLFASGCSRWAAALMGVAPAVHISLAIWLWVVVVVVLVWERRNEGRALEPLIAPFAAGCAVSAISLVLQLTFIVDLPHVDPSEVSRYLNAFVALWDFHRAPVSWTSRSMQFNMAALVVASASLIVLRRRLPPAASFLPRGALVCGLLAIPAVMVSRLPPEVVPATLLAMMPTRIIIINTMMLIAMTVGIAATLPSQRLRRIAPAAILLALAIYRWDFVVERVLWEPDLRAFRDYTNDPLLAAVATERKGMLLTAGSLRLIQLQTRRPVLLDGGGLDALVYAPEGAPHLYRVLQDVYGIDLLNPPDEALHTAKVPNEANLAVWSKYSRSRWMEIGRTYGVTQVLTPVDWSLDLPLAVKNDNLRLYLIP